MKSFLLILSSVFLSTFLALSAYFVSTASRKPESVPMKRIVKPLKKKNPEVWLEKDAQYRLSVRHNLSGKPGYLDLRTLCVPGAPENGLKVYDSYGKRVKIHQYDSLHALLPPTPKAETYEIYYGFPTSLPPERWDRGKMQIPDNFRLKQHNIMRRYPNNPGDAWKIEHRKKMIPYSRARRDLWNAIGGMITAQADFICSIQPVLSRSENLKTVSCTDYHYAEQMLKHRVNSFKNRSMEYLESSFFSPFRHRSAGDNASRIFFTRRPFDTDRNLLTCFKGNLMVPADGEYEFRLNTNSSRIFRMNGKTVSRRLGLFQSPDPNTTGSSDYLTLFLKKGAHFIEFLYYKESMATWASLSWRKKGEGKFRLMCDDDFAPAYPVEPLKLEDARLKKYPLVLRNDSLALFTTKREPYSMDRFTVLNGRKFAWEWELDGQKVPRELLYLLLKPEKSKLKILPEPESGYCSFTVPCRDRAGEKAPLSPDLALKIWSPYFLYDDEYCTVTLEISSALPADFTLIFNGTVSRQNPYLTSFCDYVSMPAMPMEHENRFAGSQIEKRYFHVDGKGIGREELAASYKISVPLVDFDEKGIVFSPIFRLPDLQTNSDGLCDRAGRKVIPILHRMTLHEVRAWELLRKIGTELHTTKRVVVIAENFGDFKEKLAEVLKKYSVELDFIEWKKSSNPSGSAALETIPEIMKYLKNSEADAALLIPLGANRHGTLGMREEINAAALVAELLLNRKPIRSIILATPFPVSPEDENLYSTEEQLLSENLRKLRREKGVRVLELNAILKKGSGWNNDSYRENGEKSLLPIALAGDSAELIASEITRK